MTDLSLLAAPPTASSVSRPLARSRDQNNGRDQALMDAAQKLEATFLSEMLKVAGMGKTRDAFGGGGAGGEDQFASFLRQAQAEEMVKAGGHRSGRVALSGIEGESR